MRYPHGIAFAQMTTREPGTVLGQSLDGPLFRLLFERSRLAMLLLAPDGRAAEVNPAWERLWGTTADDLESWNVFDDPQLATRGVSELVDRAFAGESVELPELRCAAEGGATRLIRAALQPLVDDDGRVQAVLRIDEEIAAPPESDEAERRLEVALRESETRFHAFMEHSPAIAMIKDEQGRYVYANKAWLEAFDIPLDEMLGKTVDDFYPPELARKYREDDETVLAGGSVFGEVHRNPRPDGSVAYVLAHKFPIVDASGRTFIGFVGIDVTDRTLSEERYRELFQSSPISLWEEDFSKVKEYVDRLREEGVTDLRTHFDEHPDHVRRCAELVQILQVNAATVRLAEGTSEEELLGDLGATFTDETYEIFRDEIVALAEGGTSFEAETTGRTLQGNEMHYAIQLSLSPGAEETWSKVLVSGIDITQRKRAEAALRASERRFAVAFESSPVTLSISTLADGRFVAVNQAGQRVFGYTQEESVGRTAAELGVWFDFGERENLVAGIEEGETRTAEVVLRTKSGDPRTYVLSVARFDIDGQAYLLSSANDVTEQKRAEEGLRSAEARYRTLVEQLPLVTYAVRLDTGAAVYVSPQVEELVGYSADELLAEGHVFAKLLHPDEREELLEAMIDARNRRVPFSAEHRLVGRDGRVVWVQNHATTVYDAEGRPLHGQGFLLDVTAEKAAQQEHNRLEAELRQAQKMEAIGRLAGGLAHDFNNLLTAIGGYTEFLLDGLPTEGRLRSDAEEIRKGVERAGALTRQLLAFSRRQVVQRQSLDLNEIVSDMDRLLRRLIGTDVELVTVLAPELGLVDGDRSQLEQVIVNLALNARDAMPAGGKLVLETANVTLTDRALDAHAALDPGDYVVLAVRDTGVGIDPEMRGRIFEPFFTTKDVGRGTGLGLSTVYGIVEQGGGRIYVYSEPDRGTTFKIYLPRSTEPAADTVAPTRPVTSLGGGETVLLVEDEEVLRALAARTLRQQGYEVLEARYASQALELWHKRGPDIDLVVSDIVMPGMSGVELAERLAAERAGTRILLMSGFADSAVVERVPPSSRAGFLEKPFTPNTLLEAVRQAVDRA